MASTNLNTGLAEIVCYNNTPTTERAALELGTVATQDADDLSVELGAEMNAGENSIGFTQQNYTGDGDTEIDWTLGNKAHFTFGDENEEISFTDPTYACNLLLVIQQDSVGSRTIIWPGDIKWQGGTAPTLSTTANAVDIVCFYFDGTDYYGFASLDFDEV